ncbi:unnamed protein product [Timema podura]|uniref:DH domain-containing protein n=1 Tax=Timema podura TaxID=61482 RepID=A0ABN7NNI4_TIMPD|nr:unnamed protein product [Timema podura]
MSDLCERVWPGMVCGGGKAWEGGRPVQPRSANNAPGSRKGGLPKIKLPMRNDTWSPPRCVSRVLNLAEDFLDLLQLAMKGKSEEDQCVGSCFLQVADKMKLVYGLYCMNHDNALTLFEKYESNPDIKTAFDKGLETLRYQIVCFDMSSILIKPVQRILKYPLIINELIKVSSNTDSIFVGLYSMFLFIRNSARDYIVNIRNHMSVSTNEIVRDFVPSKSSKENRLHQGVSVKQSANHNIRIKETKNNFVEKTSNDELKDVDGSKTPTDDSSRHDRHHVDLKQNPPYEEENLTLASNHLNQKEDFCGFGPDTEPLVPVNAII